MKRWLLLIVMLAALVASAVTLVGLKHQGRQLFIALERAGRQLDTHQVEWSRLQIELAWLGESGRIERQASERLDMVEPRRVGVLVARDG